MLTRSRHDRRQGRRGATFIIVLAILSVLFLVASVLTYTSQLDLIAADEYGKSTQDQAASVSGAAVAAPLISRMDVVADTQLWSQLKPLPLQLSSASAATKTSRMTALDYSASTQTDSLRSAQFSMPSSSPTRAQLMEESFREAPCVIYEVEDESGKFDLNTLGMWSDFSENRQDGILYQKPRVRLTDALDQALKAEGIDNSALAKALARRILAFRYGPDGQPGKAGVDDDGDGSSQGTSLIANAAGDDLDGRADNPGEILFSMRNDGLDQNMDGNADDADESLESNWIDDNCNGKVDEDGESVDEADEAAFDPRSQPRGDDRLFLTIEELRDIEGVTPEIYKALEKHFTVHSTGRLIAKTYDGQTPERISPVSLNYSTADEILEAIRRAQPDKDEALLVQWTANLIDWRDPDHVPTQLPNPNNTGQPILGVEINPVINEIYSDATTSDELGDRGEYVEIYNPYAVSLDLTGIWLDTGSGRYPLRGTLPPQGFLIVTDNYEESDDAEEDDDPTAGSFYDITGMVRSGIERQLIEFEALTIPNDTGAVALYDTEGHLLDYAPYSNGAFDGASRSLQRGDPRLQYLSRLPITPFEVNYVDQDSDDFQNQDAFEVNPLRDRPFTSPADALLVYCGYISDEDLPLGWRYPTIENDSANRIDSRIIDIFTLEELPKLQAVTAAGASVETAAEWARLAITPQDVENIRESLGEYPQTHGRININTCGEAQLLALPDMTPRHARRIMQYRQNCRDASAKLWAQGNYDETVIPFEQLGDLLRLEGIWDADEPEVTRIERFASWMPCISVHSEVFSLEFGPKVSSENASQRRRLQWRQQALIAVDGKAQRVIQQRRIY
ncbi:general secretion pathway protein GspK [Candidatus Sumerlaeota bacterium]|nr:general secretion pathway protein GspK [Candidatus Sumerlaeota bacterium]